MKLRKHCIETEAKNHYERLIRKYFKKSKTNTDLSMIENQIVALKYFLDNSDFGYLRSTYPDLSGRCATSLIINISADAEKMRGIHIRLLKKSYSIYALIG